MKYSQSCLSEVIQTLNPKRILTKEAVRDIGYEVFLFPENYQTLEKQAAIKVLREAAIDLHDEGCFEFGDEHNMFE